MPARGRTLLLKSNVVKDLPILPYRMTTGTVAWKHDYNAESGEGTGSGTITYQGVDRVAIEAIERAYPLGSGLSLYGIALEVETFAYERSGHHYGEGDRVDQYTVTITLRHPSDGISTGRLDVATLATTQDVDELAIGQTWRFSAQEIITDGQNSISLDDETQGYNNAELTGGFSDDDQTEARTEGFPTLEFCVKDPVKKTFVEISQDLTLPPENTKVLRDTTSLFDRSGEKKVKRTTVQIDGTPETEEIEVWGFDYTYSDIHAGDGVLFSANPQAFWKPIEYRKTQHVYKKADGVTLSVKITAPGDLGDRSLRFVVPPEYSDFASVDPLGGTVTFRSEAFYLVESVTTGWTLARLKEESDGRNSLFTDDPYYPYFFSRKIPFFSRKLYLLKSSRRAFGEKIEPPFQIQFADYNNLTQRLKNLFSQNEMTEDGKVALLIPDPNYVEPLYVAAEGEASNSFAWAYDPDRVTDPDDFVPGTTVVAPARLMTGQQTRNEVERTITSPDTYKERVCEFSTQDPQFGNSAERIVFRDGTGKPPEPAHRIRQWTITPQPVDRILGGQQFVRRYYVSTPNARRVPEGGSVSFPEATTPVAALRLLRRQMRSQAMQNSQAQKTVTWFYPQIRGGHAVITEADRFANRGTWIVTSVGWNLEYQGTRNPVHRPIVTTPGTQLTLGLSRAVQISMSSRDEPIAPEESGIGEPKIDVSLTDAPGTLGRVLPDLPNRRNF